MAEFFPSRIYLVRELWKCLEEAKDLEDAKIRFRERLSNLILNEAPDSPA